LSLLNYTLMERGQCSLVPLLLTNTLLLLVAQLVDITTVAVAVAQVEQ
jgi:hypothetical protein